MDICTLAGLGGDTTDPNCTKWFDNTETNLWTQCEKLNKQQVRCWQYAINRRFSKEDRTASCWLKEFIYNSSTDGLRSAVEKKYNVLDPKEKEESVMPT